MSQRSAPDIHQMIAYFSRLGSALSVDRASALNTLYALRNRGPSERELEVEAQRLNQEHQLAISEHSALYDPSRPKHLDIGMGLARFRAEWQMNVESAIRRYGGSLN